jgi:hypothetical protein
MILGEAGAEVMTATVSASAGTPGIGPARTEAMREYEEDPKKPQPVRVIRKGSNAYEAAEATPWLPTRKDLDRDRHRHV